MPKKYIKKTARCDIDERRIQLAITAVLRIELSQYKAAQDYGVKRQTIQSRIKVLLKKKTVEELLQGWDDSGNESGDDVSYSSKYTSQQVFTTLQESDLVAYVKRCADMNYGLTYEKIRYLAYEYAKVLPSCKLPKNWHLNKIAGIDWMRGFMHRHGNEISLRKPENTSLARFMAFNKPVVENFFSRYVSVLEKYKFKPNQIWNLDETGLTTVMEPPKVVATKGKKQVANVSSQERGELVTFVGIINAAGGNKNGWMTTELFPKVIEHITDHIKCTKENKVLLILDNHESHISVNAITVCRERGIFRRIPQTSCNPWTLELMVLLRLSWQELSMTGYISNPGKVITICHLARLSKFAYENAFTMKNITSSFKATGLWPVNSLIFSDEDFSAAEVTDQPMKASESIEDSSANVYDGTETNIVNVAPSTSTDLEKTPPRPSTSKTPHLSEIRPFPKLATFEQKKGRSLEEVSQQFILIRPSLKRDKA
ncbi:hypothetical protein NQ315_013406 [Exocentrus adspersus]|uniref:Transposase n=1 Tax=Exocentrus adspersus TaxID=1586481 RepID=A0AAV8VSD1_9CUCU|nr:hypothetical protein NQ315_013406 [Exocentrus adspersus]